MTATTSYKWAAVNENWAPLSGVEVEALNLTTLKPDDVQRTGLDGIVTFTGLPAGPHIPRVRARRVSTKVGGRTYTGQVRLIPVAMGNQGITKHYVVDANGMGTHTTIQAAVDAAVADTTEDDIVIYINPGSITENVTVAPTDAKHIVFIAEGCLDDMHNGGYNAVVSVTVASGGDASPVFAITGTACRVSFIGLEITGVTGGAVSAPSTSQLAFTHCKIATGTTTEAVVASSGYLTDTTFDNCVLVATNVRFLDSTSVNTYIHRCYANCAGLITSGVSNLHISNSRLIPNQNLAADEYFIHETGGISSSKIYIQDCYYNGGGLGLLTAGRLTAGFVVVGNHIIMGASDIGIALAGAEEGTISGNIFEGAGSSDGATGINLAASIVTCAGLAIVGNTFVNIQTGINVASSATDGTCVIGPNAYHNVGTATSGVPAAEDYQVSLATASCALLDGTIHTDTVAQGVTAGSIIIGNDAPAWDELAISVPAANVLNVLGAANGETTPSWKTVLDGTNPANIANSASPGTSLVFAHRDHVHAHPAGLTATLHHTKYTGAEAIAAVEGEATLALDGAITEIHGDANFTLSIVSSNPRLTADSGDYLEYNRAGNYFEANRMLTVPQLQTGEGLGLKVAIWGTFWGLGVQSGVFEFIASRGADGDFRWGYGTSGSLTETMFLDSGTGTLKVALIGELAADAGVAIEGIKLLDSFIEFAEIAAPANPDDGYGRLYMKNDDKLYFLATDGTEYDLTGGVIDAADVTFTPTTAADWDSDADPGDVNDALDQLAERTTDVEEKGVYEYGSSALSVWGTSGEWYAGTPFIGTVSGATTSTSVTYNHTSGETSLTRGMVLHNTTKGEKVYIEAVNIATNTLTVEADSPDDASTWDNLDALTTASQTNTGRSGVFVDIDVTPFLGGASANACYLMGYGVRRNADTWFVIVHPYEAYDVNKENQLLKVWADDTMMFRSIVPLVAAGGRHYFTVTFLNLSAANAATMSRWVGQFTKLVA